MISQPARILTLKDTYLYKMKNKIDIIGIEGIPLIKPGDDIAKTIFDVLPNNDIQLQDEDILVIAQTIISKSQGRIRNLKKITPSKRALDIYKRHLPKAKEMGIPIKEPELIQLILDESKEILKVEHVLIVETKHGYVCANAGIDKSNIEGEDNVALLPENPDQYAAQIRKSLKELTNKDVAVIISDSFGRPFRVGAVGVAQGVSGISSILDKRGSKDLFNHELQSTIVGQVDNLASAAQLVMGEANEGLPVILIRGYNYDLDEDASIKSILRDKRSDIFRVIGPSDVLKNRRSYKSEFSSEKLERDVIKKCIDLARWAPSAHNAQQWQYIILDRDENREELIDNMNKKLRNDLERDGKSEEFIKNKIHRTRENLLQAPYLILLCLDKENLDSYSDPRRTENEFILGVQSISASATYLLLAFEMENIAACWYCAPLFSKEIVKKALNLPESFVPMAFFTVGYPIKSVKAPKRKNVGDIIFE